MLITLSIALLTWFLCFHCLTILIMYLNPQVIFILILFRILDSLFVLRKVSIAILKQPLCFHCLTKLVICLNPYFIFISILFRIVDRLNHIHLPLFILSKVSIAILKHFLCFHCQNKLIICLNPYFIFISILFRIVDRLNHIHLPLFILSKVSIAILNVSMLSLSK